MSATVGRVRSSLTPECGNLSRSVKLSSLVNLVLGLLAFVMLGAALLYNYMKKIPSGDGSAAAETSKKKIVGNLTIAGLVTTGLQFVVSVWSYAIASKTINQCLA